MTEYLIVAQTRGPLPDWQAGDVVMAGPDGHGWGVRERKSAWVAAHGTSEGWQGSYRLIRVPEHAWDGPTGAREWAGGDVSWRDTSDPDEPVLLAKGRFNFVLEDMSINPELLELAAAGEIELTAARANALLADRGHGDLRLALLLGAA